MKHSRISEGSQSSSIHENLQFSVSTAHPKVFSLKDPKKQYNEYLKTISESKLNEKTINSNIPKLNDFSTGSLNKVNLKKSLMKSRLDYKEKRMEAEKCNFNSHVSIYSAASSKMPQIQNDSKRNTKVNFLGTSNLQLKEFKNFKKMLKQYLNSAFFEKKVLRGKLIKLMNHELVINTDKVIQSNKSIRKQVEFSKERRLLTNHSAVDRRKGVNVYTTPHTEVLNNDMYFYKFEEKFKTPEELIQCYFTKNEIKILQSDTQYFNLDSKFTDCQLLKHKPLLERLDEEDKEMRANRQSEFALDTSSNRPKTGRSFANVSSELMPNKNVKPPHIPFSRIEGEYNKRMNKNKLDFKSFNKAIRIRNTRAFTVKKDTRKNFKTNNLETRHVMNDSSAKTKYQSISDLHKNFILETENMRYDEETHIDTKADTYRIGLMERVFKNKDL